MFFCRNCLMKFYIKITSADFELVLECPICKSDEIGSISYDRNNTNGNTNSDGNTDDNN